MACLAVPYFLLLFFVVVVVKDISLQDKALSPDTLDVY